MLVSPLFPCNPSYPASWSDDHVRAANKAIKSHDTMAEMLCNHRAFFEGIIEHAPENTPVEQLDMYRGFIEQIHEVLNHG